MSMRLKCLGVFSFPALAALSLRWTTARPTDGAALWLSFVMAVVFISGGAQGLAGFNVMGVSE